jgi:hypothetical protein
MTQNRFDQLEEPIHLFCRRNSKETPHSIVAYAWHSQPLTSCHVPYVLTIREGNPRGPAHFYPSRVSRLEKRNKKNGMRMTRSYTSARSSAHEGQHAPTNLATSI